MVIFCDNEACVNVINHGRAVDKFLLNCAREIFFLAASYDIVISAIHIVGSQNKIADALSRWHLGCTNQQKFNDLTRAYNLREIIIDIILSCVTRFRDSLHIIINVKYMS